MLTITADVAFSSADGGSIVDDVVDEFDVDVGVEIAINKVR